MRINPEKKSEAENFEQQVDREIEVLKESHPFITKEEYWSALKQAMIGYEKLRAMFISSETLIEDYFEQGKIPLQGELQQKLSHLLLDCQPRFLDEIELIVGLLDDSSYLFLPSVRPLFAEEANPIFAPEKYGVPKILPAALVLSEDSWIRAFPKDIFFDEQQEKFCSDFSGFNISGRCFSGNNILSVTDFNVISYGDRKKSSVLQSFEHENIHAADFLKGKRNGINYLINEFIVFRIEGQTAKPKISKSGKNPFAWFLKKAWIYAEKKHILPKDAGYAIQRLEYAASAADNALGFNTTTQLLLNSETIDEFVASVNDKIKEESIK